MNTVTSFQSYKMPLISLLGEGNKEFVSKDEAGKFFTLVTNGVTYYSLP
jgi:hypothetical protein